MLAFYSGNPSLNAAEVCSFYSVRISNCLKRTKMVEKETGNLRLKITFDILFHLGWAVGVIPLILLIVLCVIASLEN